MAIKTSYIKTTRDDKTSTFDGSLTVKQNLTFGDASTDTLTVTGAMTNSATTASGLTMSGTYSTAAINISGTCSAHDIVLSSTGKIKGSTAFQLDFQDTTYLYATSAIKSAERGIVSLYCESLGSAINTDGADRTAFYIRAMLGSDGASVTTGRNAHALDVLMSADYDYAVTTNLRNADIRGARLQAYGHNNVSGVVYGAYINAQLKAGYTFNGQIMEGISSFGAIGAEIRMETDNTAGTVTLGTAGANVSQAVALAIVNRIACTTFTGNVSGIWIETPYETSGTAVSGTTRGIYFETGGMFASGTATDWDIGIDLSDSCTTAIDIGACTTGITFTDTAVTTGILFADGFTGTAIKIGSLSSTTPGTGVELTATIKRALEVNSDDNNTARAVGTQNCAIRGRHMVYADNACEDWGIDGLQKISAVAKTGNVSAGVTGRFESTGTCSTATGSGNTYCAGIMGRVGTGGSFTIGSGTYVACVLAFGNNANSNAFTNTGYHAFHACLTDVGTPEVFDVGLCIEDSAATTGIDIGNCTTGITFGTFTTGLSITDTVTTSCITLGNDITIPQLIRGGTWNHWIEWSQADEFVELLVETTNKDGTKPMVRFRLAGDADEAAVSGRLCALQLQTYNQSTNNIYNMRTLEIQSGIKGAATLLSGGTFQGAFICLEDLDNTFTGTGNVYWLELRGQFFDPSSAFNGESAWIHIHAMNDTAAIVDSIIRISGGSDYGAIAAPATYFIDFETTDTPFIDGHAHDTESKEIKCRQGNTDYYIKLYT